MEPVASNIQVLLQAAEFLERRERGEAQSLAGFQAAISLTRPGLDLASNLKDGAIALGNLHLQLERDPWEVGLGGVREMALAPKAPP